MPDLSFRIEDAGVVPFAAAPTLMFKLHINNAIPGEMIHTIALRCQIRLDVIRRRYTHEEKGRMRDLFGEPDRWSQTLHSLLWTNVNLVVPGFQDGTTADIPVPCTFDFNVAATKYFEGLTEGEIPLHVMFSGTVFYADREDALKVVPISWEQETRFNLPVKVWREMMDSYYPNSVWLSLRRDVFERLYQYKTHHGIPTWEQALERVLPDEETVNS